MFLPVPEISLSELFLNKFIILYLQDLVSINARNEAIEEKNGGLESENTC